MAGIHLNLLNTTSFNVHRYGWSYAIDYLSSLHFSGGVILDDFIEKTHSWSIDYNLVPYRKEWIGFFHNPHNMPKWFDYHNSPQNIISSDLFQESLKNCRCLITLSDYLKSWLETNVSVPVISLKHPTGLPNKLWSKHEFVRDQKIVQVGYWLRNMSEIYKLKIDWPKYWLPSNTDYAKFLFEIENRLNNTAYHNNKSVIIPSKLNNEQYDNLLASSIVLLNLYDSSANNAVIECIARNTPMIINKHPAVVEYLGENYPLYCDFSKNSPLEFLSMAKIMSAEEYLRSMDKEFLNGENFAYELHYKLSRVI